MAHVGDELRLVLAGDLEILNCSGEFTCARLQLFEKARVIDGDDGLVGEGLQQFNLLPSQLEASLRVGEDNGADALVLVHQGHESNGAKSASHLNLAGKLRRIGCCSVGDHHHSPLEHGAGRRHPLRIEGNRVHLLHATDVGCRFRVADPFQCRHSSLRVVMVAVQG